MNYQVLDVKVKDTEETGKLYTYFLDNSREIAPERVRPVIVICPGGGYTMTSDREAEPIAMQYLARGYHAVILRYSVAPARSLSEPVTTLLFCITVLLRQLTIRRHSASLPGPLHICGSMRQNIILIRTK